MPRLNPLSLSVICALALAGCAGPVKKQADQPPAVQPMLAVNHGGVTGEAAYRLGRYFEGQKRYEQAITAYQEALKRDPLLVEAYTGLGISLAVQQRYDEAIRQFQAAVILAPNQAHLHNNLGYVYLLSGANQLAVKELEEARRLDPDHERSRENLRIAQAKLAPAPATAAAQPAPVSPPAAVQTVTEPVAGTKLVEVAPQVFELRPGAKQPGVGKLEAVPLAPLPQQAPKAAPARSFKLEVSNGNGILGLAKRVAGRLVGAGVPTARLTNQRPFDQSRTEVQYRAGYAAEAAALAATLQHPVAVKPSNDLARHIDVRLVLGKDVLTDTALLVPTPARPGPTTIAAR